MTESYLIVGGSSDIAKIVAKNLLESGNSVTLLARDESRISDLEQLGAKPIVGDSLDEEVLAKAISTASELGGCLLYTSPSPRDRQKSRMPSSA